MSKINLLPLTGMSELTPAQQLIFDQWLDIIRHTYSLYGFTPIDTPIMERSEVLYAKAGGETQKQIYSFTRGSTNISLRFDLTVPLARYVAAYQNDLTFPFRRQAIGKVYRGERAQKGRYREFYQADADIIGRNSLDLRYDAEILSLVARVIGQLQLGRFQLQVNHRQLVTGFLQALHIMDATAVLHLLDQADKIGLTQLRAELKNLRLDGFEIRKIINFSQIKGNFVDFEQALLSLDIDEPHFTQGLDDLRTIHQCLSDLQVDPDLYQFNTGIIRGLDYYTGTIYETILLDHPEIGSISSGGRYDNLVGNFGKTKMPGVGCSIGLNRLFGQALSLGLINPTSHTVSQVAVLPITDQLAPILALTDQLRQADIKTDIYLQNGPLTKKLKYAASLQVPYALIIGDDELAQQQYTLRNMTTGEQTLLNLPQVIDTLNSTS